MDRRTLRSNSCNSAGGKSLAVGPFSVARTTSAPAAAAGSKEDVGERKALLPPRRPPGGTARKGQKGPKRRVQWKDTHGKKLTEVLEFQPSDSSDSDDEYLDTCICSIM
uniref:Uncharacterized protein n=1 Tax=Avena sativa TaxID=4498 RepID=A0ACD5TUB6_AVESA